MVDVLDWEKFIGKGFLTLFSESLGRESYEIQEINLINFADPIHHSYILFTLFLVDNPDLTEYNVTQTYILTYFFTMRKNVLQCKEFLGYAAAKMITWMTFTEDFGTKTRGP